MKKLLKIGAVAVSAIALIGTFVNVQNANAQSEQKPATVCLYEWENTCSLDTGYDFWEYPVSINDITLTGQDAHLDCTLMNSASNGAIQIQLSWDLMNGTHSIDASNFEWNSPAVDGAYKTWTLTAWSINNATALNNPATIYTKAVYEMWQIITLPITIEGTVPGGTPAGRYTGTVNITYPAWAAANNC